MQQAELLPGSTADAPAATRFSVSSWRALAITLLMFAIAAVFLTILLGRPSDGARLEPGASVWRPDGVIVTPLRAQPDGLRPGDVVVAVDGIPLTTWSERVLRPLEGGPARSQGQQATYTVVRDGNLVDVPVRFGRYPLGEVLRHGWAALLFALLLCSVGMLVFLRRPDEPAARIFMIATAGLASSMVWAFGLRVDDLLGGPAFWLFHVLIVGAYTVGWIGFLHFWLVFPSPSTFSRRRWLLAALYVVPFVFHVLFLAVAWSNSATTFEWLGRADGDVPFLESTYLFLALVAIGWRFRTIRDPVGRRQVRWVVAAAFLVAAQGLVLGMLPQLLLGEALVSRDVVALLAIPLPVTIAIAVLRFRLFDIEPVITRIVVYGTLTALVIGIYVVVVGYLGARLQATENLVLSIAAAGVVAVAFSPARSWLQGAVTRLLYGDRDQPYLALARLGQRLEGDLGADAVLPAAAETVARTLKLPYVALTQAAPEGDRVVATFGASEHELVAVPLVYRGERVGDLLIAPRDRGEPFTSADVRLLNDLARHVAAVAYSVHLAADLQRSRQAIVSVREEERRRLRRDLHDGLGPALASVTLKLDAAGNLMRSQPEAAEGLVSEASKQVRDAVAGIRSLVHALRPPALDELGLVAAIREYAAQLDVPASDGGDCGLAVSVDVDGALPPLSAAVEVAAYRIATEAVTNVVRHAGASTCAVRFAAGDGRSLLLEVIDDGVGIAAEHRAGVGLQSMRERAAELGGSCVVDPAPGGGTRVHAVLPLQAEGERPAAAEEPEA